jgi:hypothetical protein
MTEIPEHLLRRAAEARRKASRMVADRRDEIDRETRQRLDTAVSAAERGDLVSLGSFAKYAEDEDDLRYRYETGLIDENDPELRQFLTNKRATKPKAGLFVVVLVLLLGVLAVLLYFLAYFVLGADDDMPVCYSAPGIEVRAQDCDEVEINAGFNSENF